MFEKVRTDGLPTTFDSVISKLNQPLPLGCNVGTVVALGTGVSGFRVGDRVASNGPHAELVSVSQHLCAVISTGVSASFIHRVGLHWPSRHSTCSSHPR